VRLRLLFIMQPVGCTSATIDWAPALLRPGAIVQHLWQCRIGSADPDNQHASCTSLEDERDKNNWNGSRERERSSLSDPPVLQRPTGATIWGQQGPPPLPRHQGRGSLGAWWPSQWAGAAAGGAPRCARRAACLMVRQLPAVLAPCSQAGSPGGPLAPMPISRGATLLVCPEALSNGQCCRDVRARHANRTGTPADRLDPASAAAAHCLAQLVL